MGDKNPKKMKKKKKEKVTPAVEAVLVEEPKLVEAKPKKRK